MSVYRAAPTQKLSRTAALTLAFGTLVSASPAAAVEQITELSKAAIENGNLVIVGKTRRAGQTVTLDDGVATAVSDAGHNFKFELVYLPADCVVDLRGWPKKE